MTSQHKETDVDLRQKESSSDSKYKYNKEYDRFIEFIEAIDLSKVDVATK